MARPSKYEPELIDKICQRISEGESLRAICSCEDMPSKSTVMLWLQKHEEFQKQYAQARAAQADYWAEEIIEIADDGSNDWIERKRKDGSIETVLDHEHVQRSKLRIDARKWLMSKLVPKKYGDKIQHTGPDGDDPIQARHTLDFSELTNDQLRQLRVLAANIDGGAGES